ncbi:hypothetical protein YC2023_029441 [Brassica napus]
MSQTGHGFNKALVLFLELSAEMYKDGVSDKTTYQLTFYFICLGRIHLVLTLASTSTLLGFNPLAENRSSIP